ncbi:ATP-binding protein [Defluviimonas sp. SAOS-178_SWC]|uniref:ATP-binding protein n=1 Tax=Defluviimonas sp. SAOS-178_SWC TaxID=3121287 RepID=UPI0032217D41
MLYRKLELGLYGIVVAVSVAVGVMSERFDYRLQTQTLAAEIADKNQYFALRLEAAISQLVAWANGIAAAVALKPDINQSEFGAAAARLGEDTATLLNIALTTDNVVRRVFPLERNSALLGTNLRDLPDHADGIETANFTGKPTLVGPFDLMQGGRGFIMRLAFSAGSSDEQLSKRREMISIVVDSDRFFDVIDREAAAAGFNTVVSRGEDGAAIYGDPSVLNEQPIINNLKTPSSSWQVASAPISGWPSFSSRAPMIAGMILLRMFVVLGVLWFIFRLLRKQRQAEDQLAAAIEALDDGFALFDAEDKLTLWNRRYHELYKTSEDLLVRGATFEEIIRGGLARGQYPDATGQEDAWIRKRLASHLLGESVIEQQLDNGRWIRVAERRTRDGGIVGFRVDITELKLATEAAQAAERAKSNFISVLSHELRTPLTIVIGYTDLMTSIGYLPAVGDLRKSLALGTDPYADRQLDRLISTIEDMASKAQQSAKHLLSLINDLLDFSKLEAGKMRFDITDLEVAKPLHEVENLFRDSIEAKGLKFEVAGTAARVWADPIRLRQILTNLLSNAVKFTETGTIRVEASCEGDKVLFQVHDTGCGISDDIAGKIFGLFEQADSSSTRRAGGTGLGLAISKNLVELMGGGIGFESTPQSGSTFWFTVPMSSLTATVRVADTQAQPVRGDRRVAEY